MLPRPFGLDQQIRRCCRLHEAEDLHAKYRAWWQTKCLFIVCDTCGNKRCPKSANCANECTGSNKPGQKWGDL